MCFIKQRGSATIDSVFCLINYFVFTLIPVRQSFPFHSFHPLCARTEIFFDNLLNACSWCLILIEVYENSRFEKPFAVVGALTLTLGAPETLINKHFHKYCLHKHEQEKGISNKLVILNNIQQPHLHSSYSAVIKCPKQFFWNVKGVLLNWK